MDNARPLEPQTLPMNARSVHPPAAPLLGPRCLRESRAETVASPVLLQAIARLRPAIRRAALPQYVSTRRPPVCVTTGTSAQRMTPVTQAHVSVQPHHLASKAQAALMPQAAQTATRVQKISVSQAPATTSEHQRRSGSAAMMEMPVRKAPPASMVSAR